MTTLAPPNGLVRCDNCSTPALRVVGQAIEIIHVHHGEKHVTVIAIADLLDKAQRHTLQSS